MAANDINQCTFIGRLGADPEQRFLTSGDEVSNFRIACNWKTKEKDGTEWVSIVAHRRLAEICNQYLRKGMEVFIQGRMRTRQWEKNGEKRYTTEIHADLMQMLGSKGDGVESAEAAPRRSAPAARPAAAPSTKNFDNFDDDIPFFEPYRSGGLWRIA